MHQMQIVLSRLHGSWLMGLHQHVAVQIGWFAQSDNDTMTNETHLMCQGNHWHATCYADQFVTVSPFLGFKNFVDTRARCTLNGAMKFAAHLTLHAMMVLPLLCLLPCCDAVHVLLPPGIYKADREEWVQGPSRRVRSWRVLPERLLHLQQ
jgi:hypothetical protein